MPGRKQRIDDLVVFDRLPLRSVLGVAGASGLARIMAGQVPPGSRYVEPGDRSIMRLRKLLLATGAVVAAGVTALAPAAQATTPGAPIAAVAVANSTVNGNHLINLTMKSGSYSLAVFGIPGNYNCTGGTGTGVVRSGTAGIPTYEMSLTAMALNCAPFIPGATLTWAVTCNIDIDYSDLVHTGYTDTGNVPANKFHRVAGTAYVTNGSGTDCLRLTLSTGCTFTLGGTLAVGFAEGIKTIGIVDYQDLYVSGTLKVHNPTGCVGAPVSMQDFSLAGVFNVQTPDGLIDFR
jgi:hypothetical protein